MTVCPAVIRRAVEADIHEIVALLADDALGAARETLDDLSPYLDAFQRIDADPNLLLMVMERSHVIIGTMQMAFIPGLSHKGSTRADIEAVRISSAERGGGLGSQLIEWAIAEARSRGCAMVQLTSNASRTDAHRFYLRLGFVQSHSGFKFKL